MARFALLTSSSLCMIPGIYLHDNCNTYFRKWFRVLAWSWWKMTSTVNLVVGYILMAYIACCFSSMKDTNILISPSSLLKMGFQMRQIWSAGHISWSICLLFMQLWSWFWLWNFTSLTSSYSFINTNSMLDLITIVLQGVPVLGYLFWTISDNWEWADGYGPKFGLVAVDRANNLARIPRPSYHLFSKVRNCCLHLVLHNICFV